MAEERYDIDVFGNLKGDFKLLRKLEEDGLNIKANLSFSKASGGGFSKLEKLADGLTIKTTLLLQGKGFRQIEELRKGIIVPLIFDTKGAKSIAPPALKQRSVGKGPTGATLKVPKRFQPSQISKITAQKISGELSDYVDDILNQGISNVLTTRSFTKTPARAIGTGKTFATQASQKPLSFLSKKDISAIADATSAESRESFKETARSFTKAQVGAVGGRRAILQPSQRDKDLESLVTGLKKIKLSPEVEGPLTKIAKGGTVRQRLNIAEFPAESALEQEQSLINRVESQAAAARKLRSDRLVKAQLQEIDRQKLPGIQRQQSLKSFRDIFNRKEAQRELDLSSLFVNENEERNRIAFSRGLLPGDLRTGRRRLVDPRRIDRESTREIGFAGLFGATAGFASARNPLTGVLKGALGGLGGLAGATAGAALGGPGGAFIGATLAHVGLETLDRAFESITETMGRAAEAAFSFESSISGIAAILQATTDVVSPAGNSLELQDQIAFNTQKAREIQFAARSELLPLGIGGQSESSLVQGLFSGFAQRGIVLDTEQTKTIAGRFGAAIQALVPQILTNPNQLRKDVEDISSGSPFGKRTTLGIALKGIAPDLFKNPKSGNQVVEATNPLKNINQALRNSDQPSIQILRIAGALDQLLTVAGEAGFQELSGGFKSFADALSDDSVQNSLETLGGAVGKVLNTGVLIAANSVKVFGGALDGLIGILKNVPVVGDLFKTQEKSKVEADSKVKLGNRLQSEFKQLGIEDVLDISKKAFEEDPETRLGKLKDISNLLGEKNDIDIVDKFGFPLVTEQIKAFDARLKDQLSVLDLDVVPQRQQAEQLRLQNAQTKIAALDSGINSVQFLRDGAVSRGNEEDVKLQDARLNVLNQSRKEAFAEQDRAIKDSTLARLDDTKALRELRDAQLDYADLQVENSLQFNNLNRSLQEASDSLKTFGTRAKQAFASREEQLVEAANAIEAAGGVNPLGTDTSGFLENTKLNSAIASFNAIADDSGLGIAAGGAVDGLGIPRRNSPFANRTNNEQAQLKDTIKSTQLELEKLPRALKKAVEAINDLITRLNVKFGGTIPALKEEKKEGEAPGEGTKGPSSGNIQGLSEDGKAIKSPFGTTKDPTLENGKIPGLMLDGKAVDNPFGVSPTAKMFGSSDQVNKDIFGGTPGGYSVGADGTLQSGISELGPLSDEQKRALLEQKFGPIGYMSPTVDPKTGKPLEFELGESTYFNSIDPGNSGIGGSTLISVPGENKFYSPQEFEARRDTFKLHNDPDYFKKRRGFPQELQDNNPFLDEELKKETMAEFYTGGALNPPSLRPIDVNLSKKPAGFQETERKAGLPFSGVDVFGGDLLPARKGKTFNEKLEDKVDFAINQEDVLTKSFAGSVYPDINKNISKQAKGPSLDNLKEVVTNLISVPGLKTGSPTGAAGGSNPKQMVEQVINVLNQINSNLSSGQGIGSQVSQALTREFN